MSSLQLQGGEAAMAFFVAAADALTGGIPEHESVGDSSSSSSSSPRYSSTSTQVGVGSDGENRASRPQSRFYGKLASSVRGDAASISLFDEGDAHGFFRSPGSVSLRLHSGGLNSAVAPRRRGFYGKLAPSVRGDAASISLFDDDDDEGDAHGFFRSSGSVSLHSHSGGLNSAVAPRRRGRQSKDEQLAAANGLPLFAAEIADLSLPDLQKLLKADYLTEQQRHLIRAIRRRGKNKVAARASRQRRGVARTDHVISYEDALRYSNLY